jgi:hypothetical protein
MMSVARLDDDGDSKGIVPRPFWERCDHRSVAAVLDQIELRAMGTN